MPMIINNENAMNPVATRKIGDRAIAKGAKKKVLGDRTNLNGATPVTKQKADLKRHRISYSVQKLKGKQSLTRLEAKFGKNIHEKVDPVDIEDLNSPRYAADYISDVISTFRKIEASPDYRIDPNYMKRQTDLNEKMRELLIDWLNQVHGKFVLSPPTFYLGVSILDRFLSTTAVKRDKLQLVGCCAMWIAAKYEEIYAPEINDFVAISDHSYSFAEMVKAEKYIVESLGYRIGGATSYLFLRRYLKVNGCSIRLQHIAAYLLEFVQQRVEFLKFKPSDVAANILLFATYVEEYNIEHNRENVFGEVSELDIHPWGDVVERVSAKTKYDLHITGGCLDELQRLIKLNEKSGNRSVYKKYSQQKYMYVSRLDYSFPLEVEADQTMDTSV